MAVFSKAEIRVIADCLGEAGQKELKNIRDLIAFKERPLRVIFLGHGLDNCFLFRAIHLTYKEQLVGDLELISPDIDLDTCRQVPVVTLEQLRPELTTRHGD